MKIEVNEKQWPLVYVKFLGDEPSDEDLTEILAVGRRLGEREEWFRWILDFTELTKSPPLSFLLNRMQDIMEVRRTMVYVDSTFLIVPGKWSKVAKAALALMPLERPVLIVKKRQSIRKKPKFLEMDTLGQGPVLGAKMFD